MSALFQPQVRIFRMNQNGFIRPMTPREELAAFADARGHCLFDNFSFVPAVEAFYLAHKFAPHKHCLHDGWGLAVYSSKTWTQLCSLPDEQLDMPIEPAIRAAAEDLHGPDAEAFRKSAEEDVLRIIRNRKRRRHTACHDAAFREPITQ